MSDFRASIAVYRDRRMFRILLLGAMSGFPWVLIGSSLSLWLSEDGLSRSAVGWAGLIFSIYAINFLWAPLIDRIRIPGLAHKIGQRKAWIICFQAVILLALLGWSVLRPAEDIWLVMAIGLVIATASASQDITIDALRIEQINSSEKSSMAAAAAIHVTGWWSGYKIGGIAAFFAADMLQNAGFSNYWQLTFVGLSGFVFLANIGLLFIPEVSADARIKAQKKEQETLARRIGVNNGFARLVAFLASTIWGPLVSFFGKTASQLDLAFLGSCFCLKSARHLWVKCH